MNELEDRDRRITVLKERLARLSEAGININDSMDPDAVLQNVLDSARFLTGAQYGVMTTLDESGELANFLASGLAPEEAQQLWAMPGGAELFEYLRTIQGPMRVADFAVHARDMGLPDFKPPAPMSAFLTVPIRRRGDNLGSIHIAKRDPGQEFSQEDEETLAMFASQAATVVSNARRYREERRARASLETLVDTSPVGVVVFDAKTGAPLSFNREAVRIVDSIRQPDQPPQDLLEVMTVRRADGREVSLMEWPLAESLSSGETVRAEDIVLSVPDGRSVSVLLNASPIRSEDGGLESFVVTLQDMTPMKELERMRAEFLGMVSHELRTPLTSIRGSATTMQETAQDLDTAELRQFLRIIVDQADNMRELIDDLLDVARIEAGALSISPEPVQVSQLVDRARNTFLSGGGRDNLDISLEPDLPLVIADRRRIAQVIGNLLSNSARHSPQSSVIRVRAARDGVHIAISVSDEGRGIPSEQLGRLFRKFSTSARHDGGSGDTGLGLSICKGIVEAHGGRIWAESEGARLGARFTFTVPIAEEAAAASLLPSSQRSRRESKDETILVVDDDPQMLRIIRNALLGAGYDPVVTADPEEAQHIARDTQPSLALLDMMLPGSDGIQLMQDIFSIADAPVIFISAYGHEEVIARAFEAGAADYLVKPFSTTELAARVKAALLRLDSRYLAAASKLFTLGDLTIDYDERLVTLAGRPVRMTPKEYNLLRILSINDGRTVNHGRLLHRLWDSKKPGDMRSLRTLMRRLRRKLDEDGGNPKYIFSEPHLGYRMAKGERVEP